jgi:predicted O-methyltransferase YrrM
MALKRNRPIPYPKVAAGVQGFLNRKEANYLYRAPERLGDGLYVELGCMHGRSACCIAGGIRDFGINGHLYTVDVFELVGGIHKQPDPSSEQDVRARFEDRGVSEYITTVKGMTVEKAADFQYKEFNLLFIDADHSYEAVKADFEAWAPLVKPGGEISFHDANYDSIQKFMGEIPKNYRLGDRFHDLQVFIKEQRC